VLVDEGDVVALLACAERLLAMVEQGRGLESNEIQGQWLLRMVNVMRSDWPAVARSLLSSMTRPDAIPLNVIGDTITAAAVLSAVGRLDEGYRALLRARQLAERYEADISEPERPLRKHLARLENHAEPAPIRSEVDEPALVAPSLLEALKRVVEEATP
jgi:hypothetical protein